ncbi:NodT family efflux transporter outer membrane factor (OMF) lipoprotein [Stenotrophomonas maltophilia]|uniref:efflux transporter outer membrane subunit n=1 Tax=Stenotrophomonas chelatiphaga TaxID=517011 RepID=UPI000F4CD123|nr:efflux transporter outer membrane subunit [Stenotrophomonas chelatiphaga]MCS4230185.1 NodT family efflux transporter outer membrane factor (OMF) lipoprotein [Stenotrophomonas chelatiphaga]ROQ43715.1 NodT family efflux transporter outer membrane factor (OMF) lipoprotein [Stenotrophomonas maltophilia]
MTPITLSTSWRHGRPLLLAGLALALAACASSRGLQPQGALRDVDSLHSERTLADATLGAAGFPARDWWTALGDPQLDALISEGLASHPSLEAADARLRQARSQVGGARADQLPNLSVSGGYTGLRLPESMLGDEAGGHYAGSGQVAFNFSYGVDLWGGKRATWEAAVDSAHAAAIDAQAARLNLSANITQAYAGLAYAWQLHDVAAEELARSQKALQLTGQRRAAGIDSDLQVRQAEARVPAAQQQLQAAQQQIDESRTALAALVGQGPDRGLQIERPRHLDPLALQLPGVLPSALLGRRPDIVAARWRVEAAGRQIDAAKAKFYPSLNLTALAGVVAPNVGDLLQSSSTFAYIGPALSLPIFDGGRLRAGLDSKDADYDLAVASYNQRLLDALHEVADQVNAVRSLQQQAQSQQQAVDTARAAHGLAEQRYRAGIGGYLDVLTAQSTLLQAQQRLAGLQSQQVLSSIRLSQALGGGFDPTADDSRRAASLSDSSHS